MNKNQDLAHQLLERKDYEKALQVYLDLMRANPNDGKIYQWIAKCYYELKKYEEAFSASREAIKLDQNLSNPHLILTYIYHIRRDLQNAVAEARKAYDLSPELEEAGICYGALLLGTGRLEESITVLKDTLVAHPNSILARQNLAVAYREKRDYKKYAEEMRLVYKHSPNLCTMMKLLFAYHQQYIFLVSVIVVGTLMGALVIRSRILLVIPTISVIQGLLADIEFVISRRWQRKGGIRILSFSLITDSALGLATYAVYVALSSK